MHVHEAPLDVTTIIKTMTGEPTLEHTRSMLQSTNGRNKPELSTLLANLWTFRDRACGDGKDKIYSIKHICRDTTANALCVDYGMSIVQAFTDVARTIITDTKRLYILGACQTTKIYNDLPSWVPDWTVGRGQRPLKQLTELVDWMRPGSHQVLPPMEALIHSHCGANELVLSGYRVQTVLKTSSDRANARMQLQDLRPNTFLIDFLEDLNELTRSSLPDTPLHRSLRPEHVQLSASERRSLCGRLLTESMTLWSRELAEGSTSLSEPAQHDTISVHVDGEQHRKLSSLIESAWREVGQLQASTIVNSNSLALAVVALLFPGLDLGADNSAFWTSLVLGQNASSQPVTIRKPHENAPALLTSIGAAIVGRKFFTTSNERDLGMGPYEIKPDDIICLFPGAPVPFVLRRVPSTHHWALLGECYCHSYMDGTRGQALLDGAGNLEIFSII